MLLPSRFRLTINLSSAKALGITVPLSLLTRADELIRLVFTRSPGFFRMSEGATTMHSPQGS